MKDARGLEHPRMPRWLSVMVKPPNRDLIGALQPSDDFEGDFDNKDQWLLEQIATLVTATGIGGPLRPEYASDRIFGVFQRLQPRRKYDHCGIGRAYDESQPTWSPDGSHIVFTSNRSGNYEVWVMDSGGGNPHVVAPDPDGDMAEDWVY